MSSAEIKALVERMDKLTRIIAVDTVKGKSPSDQVSILDGLGFTQTEIAAASGMFQGNVSKLLKKLHEGSASKPSNTGEDQ